MDRGIVYVEMSTTIHGEEITSAYNHDAIEESSIIRKSLLRSSKKIRFQELLM